MQARASNKRTAQLLVVGVLGLDEELDTLDRGGAGLGERTGDATGEEVNHEVGLSHRLSALGRHSTEAMESDVWSSTAFVLAVFDGHVTFSQVPEAECAYGF